VSGVNKAFCVQKPVEHRHRVLKVKTKKIVSRPLASSKHPAQQSSLLRWCIYTCITGRYDTVREPVVEKDADYVLFTDDQSRVSKGSAWKVKPIPEELQQLDKVRQQRCVKILSHKLLPEYDVIIWIDGRVKIEKQVKRWLESVMKKSQSQFLWMRKHTERDDIYEEALEIKRLKLDS